MYFMCVCVILFFFLFLFIFNNNRVVAGFVYLFFVDDKPCAELLFRFEVAVDSHTLEVEVGEPRG